MTPMWRKLQFAVGLDQRRHNETSVGQVPDLPAFEVRLQARATKSKSVG
jgi:hypothetical protein